MNDFIVRNCTSEDLPDIAALVADVLLEDVSEKSAGTWETVYEPARRFVVIDGERFVGTTGALSRRLTIPGGEVPAAHVNAVMVAATHRRRGLLTRLMTDQLRTIKGQAHEPIAVLWASEGGIYQRFGYGLASWKGELEVATNETAILGSTPPSQLRRATPAQVQDVLADIHRRARTQRPGVSTRPGIWWDLRTHESSSPQEPLSAERALIFEGETGPEGYALWRSQLHWAPTSPKGSLHVNEVMATNEQAYVALWRYLFSVDLVRLVRFDTAATDEPLVHLATNPHAIAASTRPGLWVRIVDPATALAARRYFCPVDLVIDVRDALLPENEGHWHLVGDRHSSVCVPTDAKPDLQLDISTLGAVYLGGNSLVTLAAAGRVRELSDGATRTAALAFDWPCAPRPQETF